jgi:hypothetical protein
MLENGKTIFRAYVVVAVMRENIEGAFRKH